MRRRRTLGALLLLALEVSTLAATPTLTHASEVPPVQVVGISFIVQKLPGSWTCPPPWWASGAASVACGAVGSYVDSIVGQDIMVNITLRYAQTGTYTVEVRKDIITWPDSTAKTFQVSLGSSAQPTVSTIPTTLIVGPFVPDQGTVGGGGFWPFDIGALREYFIKVLWAPPGGQAQVIYDPTNTVAIYGIGPIPIWATLGRPEIQALCSDGGVPNGFGWC